MSETTSGTFEFSERSLLSVESDVWTYTWTAVLLTGLLALVVPVTAAVSDLPVEVLVVLAGLCYLGVVLTAGVGFEGVTSAVFVLALFDITVTLVEGPGLATVYLSAVDVVAVPLLFVLLYGFVRERPRTRLDSRALAVFGFAAFVGWAFVAAYVGNGPSRPAAVMFAVEQLRYLLLFVVTLLIIRRKSAWCGVYPFVIAATGNLLVSLAQVANGGMLGFPFLGEPPDRFLGSFTIGVFELATGFHAGGFVGHGRMLAMVLLMFIPLVVAASLRHSWAHVGLAGVAIAASILSIRVADTDAGWVTLILVGTLFATYLFASALTEVKRRYTIGALVPVLAIVFTAVFYLARAGQALVRASSGEIPLVRTNSLYVRLQGYAAAVDIGLANPLFGLGGKNFYLLAESYELPPETGIHNTFLSHLAATGFVGLAFYLLVVLSVLYVAFRSAIKSSDTERVLWVAMVCAMLSFHAYSSWMMAYQWWVGNAAFWLLAGITVGAAGNRYRIGRL